MLKPFQEIMAGLAKPLPPQCISYRKAEDKKGGTGSRDIPYVRYVLIMDVLDQVAGPGNWCGEPVEVYEVRGQLLTKVKLTIRAVEGEFTQYGLGWSTKEGDRFGGPVAEAFATAFSRAAMQFGFERRLWDDDEQHLAKLRTHWATGQDIAPTPVVPKPAKTTKGQKQLAPSNGADKGQEWHDTFQELTDLAGAEGIQQTRMVVWLQREYGKDETGQMREGWSTRLLTVEQMREAMAKMRNKATVFSPKQLRFLQAMPEPEAEAAPAAAGGSI